MKSIILLVYRTTVAQLKLTGLYKTITADLISIVWQIFWNHLELLTLLKMVSNKDYGGSKISRVLLHPV